MHIFLFVVYFFLLCLLVTGTAFFIKSGIKPRVLLFLFALQVSAACVHNWVAWHFYPAHGDIWFYFTESIPMKQQLLTHPLQFFSGLFSTEENFNFTNNHLARFHFQYEFMKYLNVFLDLFSFNNFYINSLLFSLPVFFGKIAFFKVFKALFKNNLLCAFAAIAIPSTLFWTACIHKDALAFLATGFFYYYLHKLLTSNSHAKKYLLCLFFFTMIFLSRYNLLIALLPAVLFWILAEKEYAAKPFIIAVFIITGLVLLFLPQQMLHTGVLENISERQKEFQQLTGNSRIYLPVLEPTAKSFLSLLPIAFVNGFFQPFPGTGGKTFYLFFSIELLAIWLMIIYSCVLLLKKGAPRLSNFDYSCILLCGIGMLAIGYTIPFAGAIVRYRSIYLPFLAAPFINILYRYPVVPVKKAGEWLWENVMAGKK
jgi:hypothetical protein